MSWIEDFDKQMEEKLKKDALRIWELFTPTSLIKIDTIMEKELSLTKEDLMLEFMRDNKEATFVDLIDKFNVKEITAKTFLHRLEQGHIQIKEKEE